MLTENDVRRILENFNLDADVKTLPIDGLLTEYGLDSLDIYELILQLQEAAGREVPDKDVDKLTTIAAIVSYFSS